MDANAEVPKYPAAEETSGTFTTWAELKDYYLKTPFSEHVALVSRKIEVLFDNRPIT